ncbi:hypothetical protein GCM10010191_64420 [Actinomadura vinacea]|uniref:Secreted protein n=1 Tax=Actinomadura vinacea TaxID=115336 RepID=A0ABN3JUT8_9ACTN
MILALAVFVLVAVLVHRLERNHRRQSGPRSPLAGSTHVQDRDAQRLHADLRFADDTGSTGKTSARLSTRW